MLCIGKYTSKYLDRWYVWELRRRRRRRSAESDVEEFVDHVRYKRDTVSVPSTQGVMPQSAAVDAISSASSDISSAVGATISGVTASESSSDSTGGGGGGGGGSRRSNDDSGVSFIEEDPEVDNSTSMGIIGGVAGAVLIILIVVVVIGLVLFAKNKGKGRRKVMPNEKTSEPTAVTNGKPPADSESAVIKSKKSRSGRAPTRKKSTSGRSRRGGSGGPLSPIQEPTENGSSSALRDPSTTSMLFINGDGGGGGGRRRSRSVRSSAALEPMELSDLEHYEYESMPSQSTVYVRETAGRIRAPNPLTASTLNTGATSSDA